MKALVLCAGKGTRLRPLTDSIPKPLVPVANRPILFYILDQIKNIGITEIGIVVSPENKKQIEDKIGDGRNWEANIKYIVQTEPKGLAHALIVSENFLNDSPFLLFLGDNLIKGNLLGVVNRFRVNNCSALILLKEVPDPCMFGVAELDNVGKVIRLSEKPKEPRSNLAMVGIYLFTPLIHRATKQIRPSWRNELEITDAIQWLLENEQSIDSETIRGWWLDTGKKEDLLVANRIILEESCERNVRDNVDINSQIIGKVDIAEEAKVVNSIIHGPVRIAAGCDIDNSDIGPFTSIGDDTKIDSSSIENSIILDKCRIISSHLKDSVIGKNCEVIGKSHFKEKIRLFIGSYSKIEL